MKKHISIESNNSCAKIYLQGAELCSLFSKDTHTEFIWQGNPEHWAKHSPILFPIVGSLKNGSYTHQDASYCLSRHGFARDMDFELVEHNISSATLMLQSEESTLLQYPFHFKLYVCYTLTGCELSVTYKVENSGAETLYFSIGGHPAFNLPVNPKLSFEDYILHFNLSTHAAGTVNIFPLNDEGLLQQDGKAFLSGSTDIISLRKDLFAEDALIFQDLDAISVTIASEKDERSLNLTCKNFPFLGIWSKHGADFVCIEPWQGITDTVDGDGILKNKLGIVPLPIGGIWEGSWQLTFS